MTTKVYYNEDSYQFHSEETCLAVKIGDIQACLRRQHQFNKKGGDLWAQLFSEGKEIARYKYNRQTDAIEALTFIELEDFLNYCLSVGIKDAVVSSCGHSFYCRTKETRMTSFLAGKFTQWADFFDEKREFECFNLRLSKNDIHNTFITGDFFQNKL